MISEYALAVWGLILGVLGIVVGVAIAVFYYRKGARPTNLFYYLDDEPLWRSAATDSHKFKLLYDDREIRNASKTVLVLWSRGPQTVPREALSNADPLRVEYGKSTEILAVDIVKQARSASEFNVTSDSNRVKINFAYLDTADGARIEILHSGEGEENPKLLGSIRGVPRGFEANIEESPKEYMRSFAKIFLGMFGGAIAAFAVVLATNGTGYEWVGAIVFFLTPLLLMTSTFRDPKRIPPSL